MFSNLLYENFAFVLKITKHFNVSSIRYNKNKRILQCDPEKALKRKMSFVFILICFRLFTHLIYVTILWNQRNLQIMNQLLVFQIGTVLMTIGLSIPTYFSEDLCSIVNVHLIFFRYLQRKLNENLLIKYFKLTKAVNQIMHFFNRFLYAGLETQPV